MRFRCDCKFYRPPSLTLFVEAANGTQAKIRAAKEAINSGLGTPKKIFLRVDHDTPSNDHAAV
jgi:hypothetical protein